MERLRTLDEARAATIRAVVADACRPISMGILTQAPRREYRPAGGPPAAPAVTLDEAVADWNDAIRTLGGETP